MSNDADVLASLQSLLSAGGSPVTGRTPGDAGGGSGDGAESGGHGGADSSGGADNAERTHAPHDPAAARIERIRRCEDALNA